MLQAIINGGTKYPQIKGNVCFSQYLNGILVIAQIYNLPAIQRPARIGPFAFHIHEGTTCAGKDFNETLGHLNLTQSDHGMHSGDLPSLFPDRNGFAYMAFYTDKFKLPDIINKTVVIHEGPDDDYTNPAGNSGIKIACGVILPPFVY